MQENQLQQLFEFIQATMCLSDNEIEKKIEDEMKGQFDAEYIEEMKKQILEIKRGMEKDGIK